jgi:polar amino acid transport system substrate-binding protein
LTSFHRTLRATLAIGLAFALGGCQSMLPGSGGTPGDTRLQQILERGELRVGVSPDFPPLNMKDKKGEIVGFEIDLIDSLAAAMKLEMRLVEKPFPSLLAALEANEVDVVISGMTMTPERNARVAFAGPYFISGTSLLTKSEEVATTDNLRDLNDASRTFTALASSTSAQFVEDVFPDSTFVAAPDYDTGVQMVLDGKADALVADFLVCNVEAWRRPDSELFAMRPPFTVEPLGIALPPDAPLLLNLVSNYLRTFKDTGQLGQLKARWMADGSWMDDLN